MTDIPALSADLLQRAIPARTRRRLIAGQLEAQADLPALRAFLGLSQAQLAQALRVSVATLHGWEQGLGEPDATAIALLCEAARHPRLFLRRARATA
ncbi:MAG: helix-turn-helix domain-containing protein [Deltaproteobacteria bacterium]|nr:helix-turn-helix domain-containing protein [Deltaproteobacteria bacterium]